MITVKACDCGHVKACGCDHVKACGCDHCEGMWKYNIDLNMGLISFENISRI